MAFSKSTSKRFVESVSAAPPVGQYDITKVAGMPTGALTFEKGHRFIDKIDQTPGPADSQCFRSRENVSNMSHLSFATPGTPAKKLCQRMSSSATDLSSKEEMLKRIRHFEYKIAELEKSLQRRNKEKVDDGHKIKQLAREKVELLTQLQSEDKMKQEAADDAALHQEISNLQQANINLETQRMSLEADLASADKNMAALREQISNLERQRSDTVSETEEIKSTLSQLQVLLDQVRYEKGAMEEQLFALQHEMQEQLRKQSQLQSKIDEDEKELQNLTNQLEERRRRCDQHEVNSNELTKKLRCLQQENRALKDNLFNLKRDNDSLKEEKSNLAAELCKARSANADLVDQLECLENSTTDNLGCLTMKYQCMEEAHDTLQRLSTEKERTMTSELQLTKTCCDEATDNFTAMKKAYQKLDADYTLVVSETDDLEKKCREMQSSQASIQAQLELFEDASGSENSSKDTEIANLADRYAHILGHQNNKQKIRHIVKIKQDNLSLRKEVTKLRTQIAKNTVGAKLQSPNVARKTKFDPAKAFQHADKENQGSRILAELNCSNVTR